MSAGTRTVGVTRRGVVAAGLVLLASSQARADDEALDLVAQLLGRTPVVSRRVRLTMPAVFPNGYTVPLSLAVDTPMTALDHVKQVRVLAPRNPIVEVARFQFVPHHGVARVSTRIRLAAPQHVVAAAEMQDGAVLMATAWVEVASNGCA